MSRAVLVSGQSKYCIECLFIQVQLPTSKEASSHDVYFFCLVFRLISPSLTAEWALVICNYETSYDVQIALVNCRMSHQAPECAIACTVSILLGWPGSAIIIDLRVCPITTKHMLTGRHKRTTLLELLTWSATLLQSAEVQYHALGHLPVPRFAGCSRVD
jgi:hypothetical protein